MCCLQGFEWNKYNQTHYDTDNPPPKIVQGYKFNVSTYMYMYVCVCHGLVHYVRNKDVALRCYYIHQIFYPDLINKRKTPTYTLVREMLCSVFGDVHQV